jgi:CheY-like chemotaxis protein
MRILVVEDEPTLATQLAEGIQSVGYVVDVAHNGVDGHFMGESEPYDAIVLDIGLPQWMASRFEEMACGGSYIASVDPDGTRHLAGESGRHRCRCG